MKFYISVRGQPGKATFHVVDDDETIPCFHGMLDYDSEWWTRPEQPVFYDSVIDAGERDGARLCARCANLRAVILPAHFVCPRCHRTNWLPTNVEDEFCRWCHDWTTSTGSTLDEFDRTRT